MARHAKALPDLRCLPCKEADPELFGKWIPKSSLPGHLKSDIHSAHAANHPRRLQELAENAQKLQDVYSGAEAQTGGSHPQEPHNPLPSMFDDHQDDWAHTPTYADYAAAGLTAPIIPSGMELYDPEEQRNRLRAEVERMLAQSEQDDEEDDIALPIDPEDGEDELDDDMAYTQVPADAAYFPYPNKVTMLLDVLDNLLRLRMSSNQFKMILWILKECKVSAVPSYNSFRKTQDRLRKACGSEPKAYTSSVGNRFFVNDIRETIARDFANPEVAKHLQFYPEETTGPISEVWQAQRWKE
ncbi:hypothetical protein C8F04DRAFT_1174856 [Mycena alexandri]|uniref:Uncharacterized protein n=1 Tax=Mycena alexandri TaxID=1745969 RepID=A0AAD6TFH7_9AGAR|nr:hypothetical protein C8F04DRAFT_1174856 [Mycena alexandri]